MRALGSSDSTYRPGASARVARRPSATFLVLVPVGRGGPKPGVYCGEVESGGVRAPCGIRVSDREYWCHLRGPLPYATRGTAAVLRFGAGR